MKQDYSNHILLIPIGSEKQNKGAFTLDVKSMLNENLGGSLGDTQCYMGDSLMLSES